MIDIKKNISNLKKIINSDTTIIAVSKKKPADLIEKAYENGILNFGENYLQEAQAKISILEHLNISWHFIGKIQSNKCKEIAKNFNWVHTVDRYKVAKLLNDNCPHYKSINVLIQVNIDDEKSKNGIKESGIYSLDKKIISLPNLDLKGIMVIPKNTTDSKLTEVSFAKTKQIAIELSKNFKGANEISMGMSNDFELAIKNGSTMIRIGTGIFGERN